MNKEINLKLHISPLKLAQIGSILFLSLLVTGVVVLGFTVPFFAFLFKCIFALIGGILVVVTLVFGIAFAINILFVHSSNDKEYPFASYFFEKKS